MTNDHEPRAVKMDDGLIIDEESGEILELPQNAGDKVEFLTYRLVELQRDMKAYEQPVFLLKLALKKELERLDLRSLQTQYGRPTIRSRTTRKGKVERLGQVLWDFEITSEQMVGIWQTSVGFDADTLDHLVATDLIPREVAEALIEETTVEYLQVSPALKTAPVVEKLNAK